MFWATPITALLFSGLAGANLAYKSRPDLAVPVLNITIPATNETAEGLIFFTPESIYKDGPNHGPAQSGPYIYTDGGELVWSGFGFIGPRSENFQVHKYRGQDVFSIFEGSHNSPMGHGHGHTSIFNNRYQLLKEIRGGGHKLADQHEFLFFDDNSALFTVYDPEIHDLTEYGATSEDQQWILDNKIQKVDTDTNRVLWEWSSLDHVDPAGANLTLQSGHAGLGVNSSQVWHYFYMNAFDVNPEKNTYLLSARSMCTIFKMDGNTGDIIWQLGGKHSDFTLGEGVDFCWQHDTRMHSKYLDHETKGHKEIISFFDNAAHENLTGGPDLQTRSYSAGKVVELDTKKHTAKLIASFRAPEDLSVRSQGNLQLLPNGNAFINWGYNGAMSEHKPDGTTIFFTWLDSGKFGPGSENYRAFKFDWHAYPYEEPALVAFKEKEGTAFYVSWNGDTETKVWKFYEQGKDSKRTLLGQSKRTGFETSFRTQQAVGRVVAEAYDVSGKLLVSSPAVEAKEYRSRLHYS
ncbi:Arylsulfotransferase ASST [Aspergillus sclerotialis]|uniref:Arylsulfotransferase ASST n=1 Tax=Aspergillus sclerotialis TaxID=2070753 RepID=A0A3A2ZE68_9EURO|nr:Arylsulfotransferase ASST [Aspergillus sclerotialis]